MFVTRRAHTVLVYFVSVATAYESVLSCRCQPVVFQWPHIFCTVPNKPAIHDSCSFHDMFSTALIATFRFGAVVDTTAIATDSAAAAAAAVVYFVLLYWNKHWTR